MNKPLISPQTLYSWLDDPKLRLFDVRYNLMDKDEGQRLFNHSHIAGAYYLDLAQDLSAPCIAGVTGRHPLPDSNVFIERLRSAGVSNDSRIVIYDDGSHFSAPRLWWMLTRWLGYDDVFILHGGLRAWQAHKYPVTNTQVTNAPGHFFAQENQVALITADEIPDFIAQGGLLFDARAPERYRGEVEAIDAKAGHIPGASCRPYVEAMNAQGEFLPADELRHLFAMAQGRSCAYYCGSGVTGCIGILAMVLAGLPPARLYPGSWSEWITEPSRPVAIGQEIS